MPAWCLANTILLLYPLKNQLWELNHLNHANKENNLMREICKLFIITHGSMWTTKIWSDWRILLALSNNYSIYNIIHGRYNYAVTSWKPSISIKLSAISSVMLLFLVSLLFCIYSIMIYVSYSQTGLFPSIQPLDEYYPYIFTQTGIIYFFCIYPLDIVMYVMWMWSMWVMWSK